MIPKFLGKLTRIAVACLGAGLLGSGTCQVRYCNDCEEHEEEEGHRSLTVTTHASASLDPEGRPSEVIVIRAVRFRSDG